MKIRNRFVLGLLTFFSFCITLLADKEIINNSQPLKVTKYPIITNKLKANKNIRIVHISDYHNEAYGLTDLELLDAIKELKPDLIATTGDMLDAEFISINKNLIRDLKCIEFLTELADIAPTYYILGNNENFSDIDWYKIKRYLQDCGIKFPSGNNFIEYIKEEITINIIGLNDPKIYKMRSGFYKSNGYSSQDIIEEEVLNLPSPTGYTVMLTHRPDYFEDYIKKADLILAGHTHGGQVVINGKELVLPDKENIYVRGMYTKGDKTLIVNQGLGTSGVNIRINCPPEIGVIDILGAG